MKQLKEHARRRLAQRARVGSASKTTPAIGTGQRWRKAYRKPGESRPDEARHRAEAWAKVGPIE